MLIPVRCFTCGKLVGNLYQDFAKRVKKGEDPEKVLDELGLKRYCCRRMLIAHVNVIDDVKKYSKGAVG